MAAVLVASVLSACNALIGNDPFLFEASGGAGGDAGADAGPAVDSGVDTLIQRPPREPVQLAVGGEHACVLMTSGEVFCWGNNAAGQLGNTTPDVDSRFAVRAQINDVKSISAGGAHTCALDRSEHLWCWGSNAYGQLALSPDNQRHAFPQTVARGVVRERIRAVSAGTSHTCAIADDLAYCWGDNSVGQVDPETRGTNSDVPRRVPSPSQFVPRQIASGGLVTCSIGYDGLKQKERVMCWGWNRGGALGNNDSTNEYFSVPVFVSDPSISPKEIRVAMLHACFMNTAGTVQCWGQNDAGQIGPDAPIGVQSGRPRFSPVPINSPFGIVTGLAVGGSTTCAVANGKARCIGLDREGMLGQGTYNMTQPPAEHPMPDDVKNLSGVESVAVGTNAACAIWRQAPGSRARVSCWGSNEHGQLGNGPSLGQDAVMITTAVETPLPE